MYATGEALPIIDDSSTRADNILGLDIDLTLGFCWLLSDVLVLRSKHIGAILLWSYLARGFLGHHLTVNKNYNLTYRPLPTY